ncbi:unnamed protein product [Sphenostylis stenocarpa]|uniref:Uncharacterized protein n=1 Tax=Sphenostylis stenocarpa TaxID=92480 RepID=A0AA86W3Z1_9FABA|nr:unnamed protein product [Sphenostylis stenocarpa]
MNLPLNHCYDFIINLYIYGGCNSLTNFTLDFFPKPCVLTLCGCPNLQKISQGYPHNHLRNLTIQTCSQFESFPSEGLSAPQLENFYIANLEILKSLPEHKPELLPSLTNMWITDCPGVEFSDGLKLSNCSKPVASLKEAWGANPSLERLFISEEDVESFPGEGLLPLSLTTLTIYDCPNLKKLDYNGLSKLSSVEELFLRKCPILQCLPEEGLPESISTLQIINCPLLKQSCKKQGEDWEKIADIKNIWIDHERKTWIIVKAVKWGSFWHCFFDDCSLLAGFMVLWISREIQSNNASAVNEALNEIHVEEEYYDRLDNQFTCITT